MLNASRQPFLLRLKDWFGFYNLTNFEVSILKIAAITLSNIDNEILQKQLRQFNRVNRQIDWNGNPAFKYGYTDFYIQRFGKPLRSDVLFQKIERNEEFEIFRCVVCDEQENRISVRLIAIHGQFFSIKFASENRVWYPQGDYRFEDVASF